MHDSRKTFIDKCIKAPDGAVTLAQRPNIPIVIWGLAWAAALLLHGQIQHIVMLCGSGALAYWALLEVFQGINYSRRLLGLVVLVFVILR